MSRFGIMRPGRNPTVNRYAGEEQPLGSPAQTANIAGAFADPLGLIDIFGQYPAFPEEGMTVAEMAAGPRSPSLAQNIADKEYLTAIIQLAGAIPAMAPVSKAARQALRAYHGTPHRFPAAQRIRNKMSGETFVAELDNPIHRSILEGKFGDNYELVGEPSDLGLFDMNRIGQGEGAQAFGRGLYFSGSENIAKDYREDLTGITQRMLDNLPNMEIGKQAGSGRYALYDKETGFLDTDYPTFKSAEEAQEYIDNPPTGALYSVDLNVDESMLLDYDAPLIDQYFKVTDAVFETPFVKKLVKAMEDRGGYVDMAGDVLENRGVDVSEGADIYGLLENSTVEDIENFASNFPDELGGPEQRAIDLAKQLKEAGVPGISYEAGRHSGFIGDDADKVKNYVIFDDELIKIVDRKREGGPVMDPTIDIFDPEEPVNRRQRAQAQREMLSRANDPLLTPAQAANISGGFAPAAGFADVLGLYPAFPDADMTVEEMAMGPRSPSLMQNVMEGNLLDSALQIAGLLPVVGGVAKSARVARAARGSMDEFKEILEAGIEAKDPNLRQVIDNHPAVLEAQAQMGRMTETNLMPNYGTPEWQESRVFQLGSGVGDEAREVVGYEDALEELYEHSKKFAWTDDKMTYPGPAKASPEKTAIFVIGPPAAGKSSISNPIARKYNATIIDPDEAKKMLPEYQGGVGANAVHRESVSLAEMMQELAIAEGDNLVIPQVGHNAEKMRAKIKRLQDAGYKVQLLDVAVPAEEAAIRMFRRFGATGRILPVEKLNMVGNRPSKTYDLLKEEGAADGFARIDNSVGERDPKPIIEDDGGLFEGTEIRLAESRGRRYGGSVQSSVSRNNPPSYRTSAEKTGGITTL